MGRWKRWSLRWTPVCVTGFLLTLSVTILGRCSTPHTDVYRTNIGEQRRIELVDGNIITLNTDSALRVTQHGEQLTLQLVSGEALFELAPHSLRSVDIGVGSKGSDYGDRFDVRLTGPETAEVLALPTEASTSGAPDVGALLYHVAGKHRAAQVVNASEIERRLAWREGKVQFDDTALTEAIAEINRYNRQKLVIVDPHLSQLRIGGGFRFNDPKAFSVALGRLFGVRVTPTSDAIRLTAGYETSPPTIQP